MIIASIILWLDNFLYSFSEEARYARYQERMHNFLSQATDRIHLESLEREWDRQHGNMSWR